MSSSPSLYSSSDVSSSSEYHDDSSDVDELDRRSRRLTKLLRRNINKATKRRSILENVREKAWLLEDQARLLERQTSDIRDRLASRSFRRKLVISVITVLSLGSIYYVWKPFDVKK